jgi:two-component system chemotaxis response regulator CheV
MAKKDGILLECGTNEVELLEFTLGGQSFGINVLKIQAIEQFDRKRVTKMPLTDSSVPGTFLFRDRNLPLIDLGSRLNIADGRGVKEEGDTGEDDFRIVLVTEFNEITNAFLVESVNRIHRISWDQLSPLSKVFRNYSSEFTGSVNIEGREILVVDVEKIVADTLPAEQLKFIVDPASLVPKKAARGQVKILLADDSNMIRNMIAQVLHDGGYTDVTQYDNGGDACEAVLAAKRKADAGQCDLRDEITAIITDIEMPRMDGLTFCRKVKTEMGLKTLPVVLFSSLINEQMAGKCESVGADAYITKPQFNRLVSMLDELVLEGQTAAA